MCISTGYFDSTFFLWITSKFDENERYYWNSWSAQLLWNRSTELREGHNVWICIFTGNADLILLRSNLYPLFSDCPSLMLEIAIYCIQHSQAMLERRVCELAHSFFHLLTVYKNVHWKQGFALPFKT